MYEVVYSDLARKFLKKLQKKHQEHILCVVERARIRPERYFERLVGEKTYKLRAGDYRIIADIEHDQVQITVIQIGHRKNLYK